MRTVKTQIKIRRDTTSNWSNHNPILALGELGYDTKKGAFKVGDGITPWNDLGFIQSATEQDIMDYLSSTSATYMAYADSADGSVGFSTTDASKHFVGFCCAEVGYVDSPNLLNPDDYIETYANDHGAIQNINAKASSNTTEADSVNKTLIPVKGGKTYNLSLLDTRTENNSCYGRVVTFDKDGNWLADILDNINWKTPHTEELSLNSDVGFLRVSLVGYPKYDWELKLDGTVISAKTDTDDYKNYSWFEKGLTQLSSGTSNVVVNNNSLYVTGKILHKDVLYAENWQDNTYKINQSYPIEDYWITELQPYGTKEQVTAYRDAIVTRSPDTNDLQCLGTVPTVDIPIMYFTEDVWSTDGNGIGADTDESYY